VATIAQTIPNIWKNVPAAPAPLIAHSSATMLVAR
jgi:hypothetical protein